jgi:hypothetical protein
MKNVGNLLVLVFAMCFPSSCSEEKTWRDLESAVGVDNSLIGPSELELKRELS